MSTEQTAPAPERTMITSRREYVDAVARVIGLARHEIRIFDPDLADLALNNEEAARTLHQFFIRGRTQRLFIAVHDTEDGDHSVSVQCTLDEEKEGILQVIYQDGKFYNETSLTEIRGKIEALAKSGTQLQLA